MFRRELGRFPGRGTPGRSRASELLANRAPLRFSARITSGCHPAGGQHSSCQRPSIFLRKALKWIDIVVAEEVDHEEIPLSGGLTFLQAPRTEFA